jgi:hypothetical protein
MSWATFWASLSQTHLVTLTMGNPTSLPLSYAHILSKFKQENEKISAFKESALVSTDLEKDCCVSEIIFFIKFVPTLSFDGKKLLTWSQSYDF